MAMVYCTTDATAESGDEPRHEALAPADEVVEPGEHHRRPDQREQKSERLAAEDDAGGRVVGAAACAAAGEQGHHPGDGKKQGGVIGDKGRTRVAPTPLFLKII